MSTLNSDFTYCNEIIKEFENVVKHPVTKPSSVYYTGVDLGTAFIVVAVLDENFRPVAGEYRYASVVKDGMIVDYLGAIRIVREMKENWEQNCGMLRQPCHRVHLISIQVLSNTLSKALALK